MPIKVEASILAFDLANIEKECKRLEKAHLDGIHIDVMDGHFVKNITMGPDFVKAIRRSCNLFLDVHLMMYNPYDYIERFAQMGADQITIHYEATEDIEDTLEYIQKCNCKAGISFNPETPFSMMPPFLPYADAVLLMSVNPGFSGQKFETKVLKKIEELHYLCSHEKPFSHIEIQVDGGINYENAKKCVEKGAQTVISGSFLAQSSSLEEEVQKLKLLKKKSV